MSNEKKEQKKEALHAAIVGASTESVQRYGTAVKEHIVAYTGIDYENARQLERSLKEIAKSSINPNYAKQNYKQQAGFSAEVKEVANTNTENIINRSDIRKIRTDDLGSVNDPLFDFKELDANGNVIPGSGIQMKFVGSNPKEALNKLRIPIIAEDTGKNYGRTLYFNAEDGMMRIKSVNKGEWTW